MKKKLFSLIMSLALVLTTVVVPVNAASNPKCYLDDHFKDIKLTTNAEYSMTDIQIHAKLTGLDDEGKEFIKKKLKGTYHFSISYKHVDDKYWETWSGNDVSVTDPKKGTYEVKAQIYYYPTATSAPVYSKWSTVQTFEAGNLVTKPTTLKSVTSTTTTVTAKWKKMPNAEGYEIYLHDCGHKGRLEKEDTDAMTVKVKSTKYTYKDLKVARQYKVCVRPYYKVNGKTVYADYAVMRIATKPTKVTIKSVTSKKNSITVKWKDVTRDSGYQVAYKKAKADKYTKVLVDKPSQVTKTIKKLSKNTKYNVKVRAVKKVGNGKKVYGAWSKVETIRTKTK